MRRQIPAARSYMNKKLLRGIGATIVVFMFALTVHFASAEDSSGENSRDLEWYVSEVERATMLENYQRAFSLLEQGRETYPQAVELVIAEGELYADRGLYGRALEIYRSGEEKHGDNTDLLHGIAETLGRLGRDREANDYYERLLELEPDNMRFVGDAGWNYFKTQQARKGVQLVEAALERVGPDPGVQMTLGTLYAALYEEDASREAYTAAIEGAREQGNRPLEAVALYNLSLLERIFHEFERSYEATGEALEASERASAYIARGELERRRMDFAAAERNLERAYVMDQDTPLPRMALSLLYRRFGMLDKAIAYGESVADETDGSWLYGYGSDDVRHRMNTHETLFEAYRARYYRNAYSAERSVFSRLRRLVHRLHDRVMWWYHERRFRRKARAVSERFLEAGQTLDGLRYAWKGQGGVARLRLRALERARKFETERIPEAEASYRLERALIQEDRRALEAIVRAFEPPWENESRERALGGVLTGLHPRRDASRYDEVAAALFRLNPGGLLQRGCRIPAVVMIYGEGAGGGHGAGGRGGRGSGRKETESRIISALERAGVEVRDGQRAGHTPVLELSFTDADRVEVQFRENASNGGDVLQSGNLPGPGSDTEGRLRNSDIASFADSVVELLSTPD